VESVKEDLSMLFDQNDVRYASACRQVELGFNFFRS
jgi:hypothetical protein